MTDRDLSAGKSCPICQEIDNSRMVQCDVCDRWFHYECVNVNSSIEDVDWKCNECDAIPMCAAAATAPAVVENRVETHNGAGFQERILKVSEAITSVEDKDPSAQTQVSANISKCASKCSSAKERRRKELELKMLEEEHKANMRYIRTKFEVMLKYDNSDYSEDEVEVIENQRQRSAAWSLAKGCSGIGNFNHKVVAGGALPSKQTERMCTSTKYNIGNKNSGTVLHDFEGQVDSGAKGLFDTEHERKRDADVRSDIKSGNDLNVRQMYARQVVSHDLPVFSGKPEEWPLFLNNFENSTKLCGFTNAENLLRLQQSLKGRALEYVSSRLTMPELVPEIMSTLRMVFGRPEHIINNLLSKLRTSAGINVNKLETLVNFALDVKNVVAVMQAADLCQYLQNPILIQELLEKLPAQIKLNWAMYARAVQPVDMVVFANWLFDMAEAANCVVPFHDVPTARLDNEKRKFHRVGFHGIDNKIEAAPRCFFCNDCHYITNCGEFKDLSYDSKWNEVNNKRLCRSCLKIHDLRFCRERKECGVNGCSAKHHPMLHKPDSNEKHLSEVVSAHFMQTSNILFKILPVTIYNKNHSIDVFVFFDDGSGPTLIEESILKALNLTGTKSELCLKWTDGSIREEQDSQVIDLQISERGKPNKKLTLRNARSVKRLDLPEQTLMFNELNNKYKHLKGLFIPSYRNAAPKVIIGLSNKYLSMQLKYKEGSPNEPAAMKTRLGWTIYGVVGDSKTTPSIQPELQLHICECNEDAALNKLVVQNYKMENEEFLQLSYGRLYAEKENLLKKYVWLDKDHFVAKLLWKSQDQSLPLNYEMVKKRLLCFEKKLSRDSELRSFVNEHIAQMEAKGYIRKLCTSEENAAHPRKWYLPIFSVRNPNKPSKIRIVWDAAAEYQGVSLNSCLEKGPDLLTPLVEVLFNFRVGKIGISGDISEMFHRVAIDDEDQQSQRFIWRNADSSREPDTYVLRVMSFGASCSPSLAQFAKNLNATYHQQEYPRAAMSIMKRHYVDDMLDSVNSIQEAIQLAKDVREVHKRGNFHIRNWLCNSEEVINALGDEGNAMNFCKAGRTVEHIFEAEKVLGMWWQTAQDSFTYNLTFTKANEAILHGERPPTKRELLRLIMSIFDPLGLISFYTVQMRILMQRIWSAGTKWDETISDEFISIWHMWFSMLHHIQDLKIPRCYFRFTNSEESTVEVHTFVDASESAYAATAYFRITMQSRIEVSLVCAKAKVAPLRPISIPRMELLAALLGARLSQVIEKGHDIKFSTMHYWTDSKTVLSWIRSDPRKFKQFVMFKVGEIQEATEIHNWHYVPSKLNVADLATKINQQNPFEAAPRWFNGPQFLRQPIGEWPKQETSFNEIEHNEFRKAAHQVAVQINIQNAVIDVHRFSKWERAVRCMAYVNRFIQRLKFESAKPPTVMFNITKIPILTSVELLWGQNALFELAQNDAFKDEIRTMQRTNSPSYKFQNTSPLKKLSPFIDETGTVRMRGRLENATVISDTTKNPIILPKNHYVTRLIIDWYHRKWKHANHETVINEIFKVFHIPGLRTLLRTVRTKCQVCKIKGAQPNPPEMGLLPKARLSPFTRPFSYTGIDFFGPFLVVVGRHKEKRYGVVFTCLTCRGVHVELAYSLTTSSCAIVIRKFMARRGTPLEFFSDNGTNLKGAEKELREACSLVDFDALQSEFTGPSIKWSFIPPASPHMGGAWERMVRSIKTVLYKIITPNTKLSDEGLQNLFAEVENIVNSRPLTYLSLESADQEALTPNHFLLGSSSGSKPAGIFQDSDQYTRSSWRHIQYLTDQFWRRWVAEVLPEMTRRTSCFQKVRPIACGDIVIVVDSSLPRHCWPKGVIIKTINAEDGQVRSAFVRTTNGEYHRPATKLAVLDISGDCPEKEGIPTTTD